MTFKPNEIRHSQVSCEFENYCLQRGQSLSYTADLNSAETHQFGQEEYIEVVDGDSNVSLSIDLNEFGSTILGSTMAGRYEGYPDETFSILEIQNTPLDVLVSVKHLGTDTKASRSAWFNNCFVESVSGSFSSEGFATESVSLSGGDLRWFTSTDSSNFGATKILNFSVSDGTAFPSFHFDERGTSMGIHYLTENGKVVPSGKYSFSTSDHTITANSDFSFVSTNRYRAVLWDRPDFPTPNDVNNPIGAVTGKEVQAVMWDATTDPIDWQTDVGVATNKQMWRVQSVDYEVNFNIEELTQLTTGKYHQASLTPEIRATISVLDSDLEHWARATGKWNDHTLGDSTTFSLSDFNDMQQLCLRVDVFNTKEHINHSTGTLLKQLYFIGGRLESVGSTKDAPGRGTQTYDYVFTQLIVRGTGAQGRSSTTLWSGKEFGFVFMSDDGISHNEGWTDRLLQMGGHKMSLAVNADAPETNYSICLSQANLWSIVDAGHGVSAHSASHGHNGLTYPSKITGKYGTLYGYISDGSGWEQDTSPHYHFADWTDAENYYLREISRDVYRYSTDPDPHNYRLPRKSRNQIRTMAYPGNKFCREIVQDLYLYGYKGIRAGKSWESFSGFPDATILNSRDAISIMRVNSPIPTSSFVGDSDDVWTETQVKNGIRPYLQEFRKDGTFDGGLCVVFTHSFGNDAYHAVNFPNGYPASEGDPVNAYASGIRMDEMEWIIEEAVAQNAKILTFNDAIDQLWEYGHYLDNPHTVYGQDFTDDVIFVSGKGSKYPIDSDYSDPSIDISKYSFEFFTDATTNIFSVERLVQSNGTVLDYTNGLGVYLRVICEDTDTTAQHFLMSTGYAYANLPVLKPPRTDGHGYFTNAGYNISDGTREFYAGSYSDLTAGYGYSTPIETGLDQDLDFYAHIKSVTAALSPRGVRRASGWKTARKPFAGRNYGSFNYEF